ncbi:MAG: HD domain-containing protein [Eubacterium sp.]|nr:HD domain-containing protein [Eubacterium sp.]
MKEYFINELKSNMEFIDFFIVKSIGIKVGSNNKQYLDLHLADKSGEVSAKKWDVSEGEQPALSDIKEGNIVKIKAQVTEWNGMKQLRVLRIRKSTEADVFDLADFIKAAPEKPEDMYGYILDCANSMADADFRKLTVRLLEDNKDRLWYYPAASRNHHAEYAGLLWHMKRMIMSGKALCKIYDFLNEDLVVTGVIIHDMEKLNEIEAGKNGIASGYSMKGQLLGHIVQGVTMIDELCKELGFDEEKAIVLEHMILTHHYEPEFGSPKKPMFPEAEILHYLDVMDARMFDMEDALDGVEPGGFTERVRTLDNRRVYRPLFSKK